MKRTAVIMTVFNRAEKTKACLDSLSESLEGISDMAVDVWITNDGSTDGTALMLDSYSRELFDINILSGDGALFWNAGMIKAWEAAICHGNYDGYLWLNNDAVILPNLWKEIMDADAYSKSEFGKGGIYVGSLTDLEGRYLTYGGFSFVNKWTLADKFIIPDGSFQSCECAHGNITYVSSDVVVSMGIFCKGYNHGGADHDYTYLAHKAGFPVFVLREYVGRCDNDHRSNFAILKEMPLKKRIAYLKSPQGLNLHNTLLFQKRCFPWRLPFVWLSSYAKALFPNISYKIKFHK